MWMNFLKRMFSKEIITTFNYPVNCLHKGEYLPESPQVVPLSYTCPASWAALGNLGRILFPKNVLSVTNGCDRINERRASKIKTLGRQFRKSLISGYDQGDARLYFSLGRYTGTGACPDEKGLSFWREVLAIYCHYCRRGQGRLSNDCGPGRIPYLDTLA